LPSWRLRLLQISTTFATPPIAIDAVGGAATGIPTLGGFGLAALLLLAGVGLFTMRKPNG